MSIYIEDPAEVYGTTAESWSTTSSEADTAEVKLRQSQPRRSDKLDPKDNLESWYPDTTRSAENSPPPGRHQIPFDNKFRRDGFDEIVYRKNPYYKSDDELGPIQYSIYREKIVESTDIGHLPSSYLQLPVVFQAEAFDSSQNENKAKPVVTYFEDHPFDPAICGVNEKGNQVKSEAANTNINESKEVDIQWSGPVIRVTISLKAGFREVFPARETGRSHPEGHVDSHVRDLPVQPEDDSGEIKYMQSTMGSPSPKIHPAVGSRHESADHKSTTTGHGIPANIHKQDVADQKTFEVRVRGRNRKVILPTRLEDLKIEQISRSEIHLLSPYIVESLVKMNGYFPRFSRASKKSLFSMERAENPKVTHATNTSYIPVSIHQPFDELIHQFHMIETFVKDNTITENTIAGSENIDDDLEALLLRKQHVKHLYDLLKPLHDAAALQCEKHLLELSPRLAFEMAWYVFKPGTDVYIELDGLLCCAVVADIRSNIADSRDWKWSRDGEYKWWLLDLWILVPNGNQIGRSSVSCRIYQYQGLRQVINLPAVPAKIWDQQDNGERRQKFLQRSRTLLKALKRGNLLVNYRGPTGEGEGRLFNEKVVNSRGPSGEGEGRSFNGKVVIDHERGLRDLGHEDFRIGLVKDSSDHFRGYDNICIRSTTPLGGEALDRGRADFDTKSSHHDSQRFTSSSKVARDGSETRNSGTGDRSYSESLEKAYRDDSIETESATVVEDLTEHQLLLLYPVTRAFALKSKAWLVISVDYVEEIASSSDSIDNLVIGKDELATIRAMSNSQNRDNTQWSADFIQGKGSGQIILLHGPPGVGKTYTVEAIAEWLERPLLALTVADIGTSERRIEAELVKWFTLAEAWNAVLLVDEADIFLERRQNRDLARNGLVSSFLRRMEYFNGLLFLTTNRVGQIDDAFISRIHVAIGYKSLDAKGREQIWTGFFKKLIRERAGRIQIAPDAKKWILSTTGTEQADLNGRDIRNALQTAITLAEFEAEEDPDYDPKLAIVVTKSHFEKVLIMCNKFHTYIASIRKEDEKKRAAGRGDRNDYEDIPLSSIQFR